MANREGSENKLKGQLEALQGRLMVACTPLPPKATMLLTDLHAVLRRAFAEEILRTPSFHVGKLVQLKDGGHGTKEIAGGPKDFARLATDDTGLNPNLRLIRDDGAVIHFTIAVREAATGPMELIAYDFEIYFPTRTPVPFIRFDLNTPAHHNDEQGLRSHIHPGHEDLQLPNPVLSPEEALTFLIYRARLNRDVPRT